MDGTTRSYSIGLVSVVGLVDHWGGLQLVTLV